jgi:hypothetical protein
MFVGRRREKFVTGRAVFYVGVCTSVSETGAVSQKKVCKIRKGYFYVWFWESGMYL